MKLLPNSLAFVILLVLGSCSLGQSQTAMDHSIRTVDFGNFTYHPHCIGKKTISVTVKDGTFTKATKEANFTDRLYFSVDAPVYGDVDGDDREDAIVLSLCNTGGSGQFSEGFIYSLRDGKPTLLTGIAGGDRADAGLRAATVKGGLITVDRNAMTEGGGECCAEFAVKTTYRWTGKELRTSGESVRRELHPPKSLEFGSGQSTTTVRAAVTDIVRYSLAARAGQIVSVTADSDDVSVSLVAGRAEFDTGPRSLSATVKHDGKLVFQVQNIGEKPARVTLTFSRR